MKSPNENPEFDRERETRVLLEDMNHSIKLIAEGHIGLNDKLDGLIGRVDKMDFKVDRLEILVDDLRTDMKIVKSDVAEIKVTIKGHDQRFTRLEAAAK